ncbi:MAG: sugar phosphate isomerase [Planctomycetota bacterium]|nr:MAG: sugar phosphate isomerase [Planctomycetota bacterium]
MSPTNPLGYCTNVHPYADLQGLRRALRDYAAPLRERLALTELPVGLWFPANVAEEVLADPASFVAELRELGLHPYTLNAFPAGAFHAERVKDDVFRPAWTDPARLRYSLRAAEALAALLPDGARACLSTHSGAYKGWGPGANNEDAIVAGLLAAADGLAELEQRTGRTLVLALEPEPLSFLETTSEVVDLFTRRLLPAGPAARRHLGLCYDACHQAVEFEAPAESWSALRAAEVPVAKIQLSSAIELPNPGRDRARLEPFSHDRWFHQVVAQHADGSLQRLPDLPDALADTRAATADRWRIHYHVPLFVERLDAEGHLLSTQSLLAELLGLEGAADLPWEIETYTFEALPPERRRALGAESLLDGLEQEFRWVHAQVDGASPRA